MANRSQELADGVMRTLTGPMWHGPALAELLADMSAEQAARRSVPSVHTVWELVLHVTTWVAIARARIAGQRLGEPSAEEDWSTPTDLTDRAWAEATEALLAAQRGLAADVVAIGDEALNRQVGTLGYSVETLVRGVIEHGAYQGGQIALLKRAGAAE